MKSKPPLSPLRFLFHPQLLTHNHWASPDFSLFRQETTSSAVVLPLFSSSIFCWTMASASLDARLVNWTSCFFSGLLNTAKADTKPSLSFRLCRLMLYKPSHSSTGAAEALAATALAAVALAFTLGFALAFTVAGFNSCTRASWPHITQRRAIISLGKAV